jgi:hypothetical protein
MPDARPIKEPCRIITEGYADAAFFNALIANRGIAHCEAECARTDNKPKSCAGKNGITDTLRGLSAYSDVKPGVLRGVIVAVDVDTDSAVTLRSTIASLKAVDPPVSCPTHYMEIKKEKRTADFAVAILGIPWQDRLGNLDTLLFEAMRTTHADVVGPLNRFCADTETRRVDWSDGLLAKMHVRCTLAVSFKDDPGLSLGHLLSRHDQPFDLANPAFNQIAEFIQRFTHEVLDGG